MCTIPSRKILNTGRSGKHFILKISKIPYSARFVSITVLPLSLILARTLH
jgi:hypothetical protein